VRTLPDDDPLRPPLRYVLTLVKHRSGTYRQTTQEVLRLLVALFVQGSLPDQDGQRLPPPGHPGCVRPPCLVAAGTDPAVVPAGPGRRGVHLHRLPQPGFRQHYGIGPVAAFELLRLARAATLLVRSNLSVAAVAHDCGFANPYHFSRPFRRRYGQPPGRYRHAPERRQPAEPLAQAGLLALSDHLWRAT
jgi:AraC family transcriptional regulator